MSFGTDVWCTDSIRTGRLARGRQVVAQALYRRVTTPRGMLRGGEEEGAYGIDLVGYVGAVGTALALRALPGIVRAEFLKDDRVADASVAATISRATPGVISVVLQVNVVLIGEGEDFSLTLSVDATSVTILGGV